MKKKLQKEGQNKEYHRLKTGNALSLDEWLSAKRNMFNVVTGKLIVIKYQKGSRNIVLPIKILLWKSQHLSKQNLSSIY